MSVSVRRTLCVCEEGYRSFGNSNYLSFVISKQFERTTPILFHDNQPHSLVFQMPKFTYSLWTGNKKKNQCVTIFCGVVWEVFEISTVSFSRPARVRSWMNRDDASAIWMIKNAGMSENLDIRYRYTNAKRYSLGSNMYRPTSFFSFCLWKQFPIDPYTTIFYFWWTSPDRADRRQRISYYEGIKEIPSVQYTWKRIALLW